MLTYMHGLMLSSGSMGGIIRPHHLGWPIGGAAAKRLEAIVYALKRRKALVNAP